MGLFSKLTMTIIGTILVSIWLLLHRRYAQRFSEVIQALDSQSFHLASLFWVGLGALEWTGFDWQTPRRMKQRKKVVAVYGARYAEFYQYVMVGGQWTYILTFTPIVFLLTAVLGDFYVLLFGLAIVALLVYYLDYAVESAAAQREEALMRAFPQMLSKLALLMNAGLVLREAWQKVAVSSQGSLYEEMKRTCDEMQNGVPDYQALQHFAERCIHPEIRKTASVLIQNLQKGNAELTKSLKEMVLLSWESKKHQALRKSELAGQRMLLPISLMFLGVLMLIVVPIFAGL